MDSLLSDLRLAVRALRARPLFAAVIAATLAVGIGTSTIIFSIVNAALLRPFPYAEPSRLVDLDETTSSIDSTRVSFADFQDWRERSHLFEDIAAYRYQSFNLNADGEPERVLGLRASANLFSLLGIDPLVGRGLLADEDRPGSRRVVVLGNGLWQRRFGKRPSVVGEVLLLDGDPYAIVGIMPPDFQFPERSQLWVPLALDQGSASRDERNLRVIGRLRDGASLSQARDELRAIAADLETEYPPTNRGITVEATLLRDYYLDDERPTLIALSGATGFLLLIVCTNVANLLLARNRGRRREYALRAALGANVPRLARGLLTESLLLALLGGLGGLLFARAGLELVLDLVPVSLPFWLRIDIDGVVLAFAIAVSVVTGLVFGTLPAITAARVNLESVLKVEARGSTGAHHRFTDGLVGTQVALTFVLLVSAAVSSSTIVSMQSIDPGFELEGLLTLRVELPEAAYRGASEQRAFHAWLDDAARSLPGLEGVALGSGIPLRGPARFVTVEIDGAPPPESGEAPVVTRQEISPGYFGVFRIPLRRGRTFAERDNEDADPVVVVNETFARRFLAGTDPIGARIRAPAAASSSASADWRTVVGVVADIRDRGLSARYRPSIYVPLAQAPVRAMSLILRSALPVEDLTAGIRREIAGIDPNLAIFDVSTLEDVVGEQLWRARLFAVLFDLFAVVALAVAMVGLYALVARAVEQRRDEIAIRIALGATAAAAARTVIRGGVLAAGAGIAAGSACACALSRVLAGSLPGVVAAGPGLFAVVAAALTLVCAIACVAPAARVARVDPATTLR